MISARDNLNVYLKGKAMVEIISSEEHLLRIVFLILLNNHEARYRRSIDAEGNDYHLIINEHGDEVAEWDDQLCEWHLVIPLRKTRDTMNSIDLAPVVARIEKQILKMRTKTQCTSPAECAKRL
ncbi:hypothetical protein AUM81_22420 [Cronobacter sakazakii]|nr:hypothetical protein AUM81_22420 [Cronobacter sakazakii]